MIIAQLVTLLAEWRTVFGQALGYQKVYINTLENYHIHILNSTYNCGGFKLNDDLRRRRQACIGFYV